MKEVSTNTVEGWEPGAAQRQTPHKGNARANIGASRASSELTADVVVVGGGFAGLHCARKLAERGATVLVLEASNRMMSGASRKNMARIHHGWHYPGSLQTALDCIPAAFDFLEEFNDVLIDSASRAESWCVLTLGTFTEQEQWMRQAEVMRAAYATELGRRDVSFGPEAEFFRILPASSWQNYLEPGKVLVASRTLEAFVDLEALAARVTRSVMSHSKITLLANHKVTGAWPASTVSSDGVLLTAEIPGGGVRQIRARHVVNASWSSRSELDASFARNARLPVPAEVTHRLRAFLKVQLDTRLWQMPSLLFVHGPFFSLTNCGNGSALISYEPVSNLATRRGGVPPDWQSRLGGRASSSERAELSASILRGAAQFVPDLAGARPDGITFATLAHRGNVDIYDSDSAIHHRLGAGIHQMTENWVSLDTGKLSWVPMHARSIASLVGERCG